MFIVKTTLPVVAGYTGLGRFPATYGQPVSLPGEEERRYQDVCSPLLQGVVNLARRGRKDEVPLRSEVRTSGKNMCRKEGALTLFM